MSVSTPHSHRWLAAVALVVVGLMPGPALADIDNAGLLDTALARYSAVASTWDATITAHASWLFWMLALISMIWTFGMMALRKADIGEFFAEFARFTIFTGFFWWLLVNGPKFAISIMSSLRRIASQANGTTSELTPSGIVDIGFDIFAKVLDKSTVWSPFASAVGIAISLITLIVLALVAVNMLVLLVSGWVLAYAGIFFLGFGGSRWTSDMAIAYFKTVLSIAVQLFAMVLLVGIGKSFIDSFYSRISAGLLLNELAVVMIASLVLLVLVNKVPALLGAITSGGGTGSLGSGLGAGTVAAAATVGAAAMAAAGGAAMAGMANIGGGAQALKAAFTKASAAESESGTDTLIGAIARAGESRSDAHNQGDALAGAMGDDSRKQSSPSATESATDGAARNSGDSKQGDGQRNAGGGTPNENQGESQTKGESSEQTASAVPARAAKAGRIALGTAAALAKGTWEAAKDKKDRVKDAAVDRISETAGGRIAAAIAASYQSPPPSNSSEFGVNEDTLSAGREIAADAAAEIAAFRDSK